MSETDFARIRRKQRERNEITTALQDIGDASNRIINLLNDDASRPLFFAMDCRSAAKQLRRMADDLEKCQADG